jgi:hypothetical protein
MVRLLLLFEKNRKFLLQIVILLFFLVKTNIAASNVITILNEGCNYSMDVPEGWDTIPQAVIKEKLQQYTYNIDLGIFPLSQKDYFNGNYALIAFAPSIKSLNLSTFDQIVSETKKQMNQGEINNDTLRVQFIQTHTEVKEGAYSIYNYYKVWYHSDSLDNCELLRLTKFGYILVLAYKNGIAETMPIEKVSALLSKSISVQPDYIYSEPQKKGLSLKNIFISLAIGIFVYVLITGFSKLKKKK